MNQAASKSKCIVLLLFLSFLLSPVVLPAQQLSLAPSDFTKDGAWCWFSDPRAVYLHGSQPSVVSGWVKEDGTIEAGILNLSNKTISTLSLYDQLEKDDHDNPAFLPLAGDKVMAFYTKHVKKYVYYQSITVSETESTVTDPITFDPISEEELKKFPLKQVTYANPFQLKAENDRIYCFGRWTGYKPNVMWSDDNGASFTKSRVFIASKNWDPQNRPYVKYHSDGQSKIHIVFTDGHPRREKTNSVYYAYYEKGSFWKADGTLICALKDAPFAPDQATVVYKATEASGRAWVHDIALNDQGDPVILYARYPTEEDHQYYYANYYKDKWVDSKICDAGKWFPQTPEGQYEREPHYSGGLTLNPVDPNELFVSREISGVFEIVKYVTRNDGKSWEQTPITKNSTYDNVRPYIPRNMKKNDPLVLLWMQNEKYIHYTDFKSSIRYLITP
ncbi:hypothetical protein FNH22_16030 [Fulvivirga sp. M361]|uniref:BNR-4 repeat-containing protein n=1 Tax=Fulvivirga sp. M361 TaxID=2594266 RepID=UPI00117A7E75|nr:BNR-4 repeat-containing protein [Fulvivirga sp. M361]TRX57643.1 hypothetical protein FNH22_16030 [Fulvivirga sp. M361]